MTKQRLLSGAALLGTLLVGSNAHTAGDTAGTTEEIVVAPREIGVCFRKKF